MDENFQPVVPIPPETEETEQEFLAEEIPVGWPWRLLLLAFVVLGLAILIYFGLRFGYQPYLKTNLAKIDKGIEDLTNQVDVADQEKLLTFYSQIVNLQEVLEHRIFSSKIPPFLEKNTDPLIYLTGAEFSASNNSLKLEGRTASVEDLMRQLTIFSQTPEVAKVSLENIVAEKERTRFNILLVFKPEFLNQPILNQ